MKSTCCVSVLFRGHKPSAIAALVATLFCCLTAGGADGVKQGQAMKYEWLAGARFISWKTTKLFSLEEARQHAGELKAMGANTVITFGYHYRFDFVDQWPQITESLKNIVTACHEVGLKVIEHHSATFVPPKSLERVVAGVPLTDCTVIDARDGKPPYFEQYQIIMLCCNNPKFRKIYFNYVLDLVKKTGVDGLMSDDIEFCPTWYVCGCQYCRAKLATWSGDELPEGTSPKWGNFSDPWFRRWLRFRMKSVGDYYVDLRAAMDKAELKIPLLGCLAGASNLLLSQQWGMTGEEFARGVDLNFYEAWQNTSNFYRWRGDGAEISYYLGIGRRFGQPMFTLHYVSSKDEQFFVWALNLLMGDRLWLNPPIYQPDETFAWQSAHEDLFRSPQSIAQIAVLFSRQTRDVYGGHSGTYYHDEWLGWSEMLLEESIPYDTILDADLSGDLSRYQLLILPNAACLSDSQVEGIRRFVRNGGRAIATGELTFFDESGARRGKAALADWIAKPPAGVTYHKKKVGMSQVFVTPHVAEGQTESKWVDARDHKLRAQLLAEVRGAAGPLPWRLVEGTGVIANVHRVRGETGTTLVAHVLNVAPLDLGESALIRRKCELTYEPKELSGPVKLEFRSARPSAITLFSPDCSGPVPLQATAVGDAWQVRISPSQIRRYGALKIELEQP